MTNLLILLRKELRGFFLSPFGWIVLTFVTVMQGWSMSGAMKALQDAPIPESLVYIVFHMPQFWFYFLVIFPLITMRLFAEEERVSIRMVVVLPAPFGPRKPTTSPCSTSKVAPATARWRPKRLVRLSTLIILHGGREPDRMGD